MYARITTICLLAAIAVAATSGKPQSFTLQSTGAVAIHTTGREGVDAGAHRWDREELVVRSARFTVCRQRLCQRPNLTLDDLLRHGVPPLC